MSVFEPTGEAITLTYRNWRGKTAVRTITPKRIWFGSTDWHPDRQWLITAFDHDKQADRDFALKDFGAEAAERLAGARVVQLRELIASYRERFTDEKVDYQRAILDTLDNIKMVLDGNHDAAALAEPAGEAKAPELLLADEILAELVRARTKFPGKNVTFAALVEEVGELATATFEESRNRVRKEAVQVAVMAMRMVLDGDHTFDDWRTSKGLDTLTGAAP